MHFYHEKDLAVCGLACVLCSEETCPGCKTRARQSGCDCEIYHCAAAKDLDGCYECPEFPCSQEMFQNPRFRAFNRYAAQFGKQALHNRLKANQANGLVYHRRGGLKGDYDKPGSEIDILRLIHFGTSNPYLKCPVLTTANFTLQLVRLQDAADLLLCYADPQAQTLFNTDNCTNRFRYQTLGEMEDGIRFWLAEYEQAMYVRFAIITQHDSRAIGTVEMFKTDHPIAPHRPCGLLRLDLSSAYEKPVYLNELCKLFVSSFYLLFDVEIILTKAGPAAGERRNALSAAGFCPDDRNRPKREYYWKRERKE